MHVIPSVPSLKYVTGLKWQKAQIPDSSLLLDQNRMFYYMRKKHITMWNDYLYYCLLCHLWFSYFDCATFQFPVWENEMSKQLLSTKSFNNNLKIEQNTIRIHNIFWWTTYHHFHLVNIGREKQLHPDCIAVDSHWYGGSWHSSWHQHGKE